MRRLAIGAISVLVTVAMVIAGWSLYTLGGVPGVLASDLPANGQPRLNVDYRAQVDCLLQFRFGDAVWRLDADEGWPPPEEFPGIREVFSTWTVPGILRFTSSGEATFRAQTDGSEWRAVPATGHLADAMCI